MMSTHDDLLSWSQGMGIVLNGIKPKCLQGRGTGIVASKDIKKDEVILEVPTRALRTLQTVPKAISRKFPRDMTSHGLLAADLALDRSTKYSPWNAVLPTPADMQTLPQNWPPALQALLPRRAASLLAKQQAKFVQDWTLVSAAFPGLVEADYLHAWQLVNTRTFYHATPQTEKRPHDDRMALQPVADLFNHADAGCAVLFDAEGFTVCSDRAYRAGEEVFVSYGAHSNDFLLTEYGFVLDSIAGNRWDEVCVDDCIIPKLSHEQRRCLDEIQFLGNYMLDSRTVCYRTEVAVRILCTPLRDWRRFVDGTDDGAGSQAVMEEALKGLLQRFENEAREKIAEVERLQCGEECHKKLLLARWQQILDLVESTVHGLGT